jgi:hypothetical protein
LPPLSGVESDFYWTYSGLDDLKNCLSFTEEAQEAISSYQKLNSSLDSELLPWLVKHERMHNELGYFVYNTLCAELNENIQIIEEKGYKIAGNEFKPLIKFCKIYFDHYFDKLDQYQIFSSQKITESDFNGEEGNQYTSLTYHLRQRGLL